MSAKRLIYLCIMVLVLFLIFEGQGNSRPPFRMSTFTVVRQNGTTAPFKAEVALSPSEQSYGLMFAKKLDADTGMIFPFPEPKQVAFWMKNTFIPLDLLFIRSDGTIAGIAANARPRDETPISSPGLVTAVIEINGGMAQKMGVRVGDRVVSPEIRVSDSGEDPVMRTE